MSTLDLKTPLINDTRGVSEVVGFILLFGIVVLLISINQAQIVPQENAEIEFKHSQDVKNDLIEVQSSLSEAGQADVSQFSTVELGVYYPTRVVAINPLPPAGRLETSDPYPIVITNETASLETGNNKNVSTRFLKHTPGYNEFDYPPTWYENSILYLDEPDRDEVVIIEDDHLGINDNDIIITALQNEFEQSGTGSVTIEAHPVETPTDKIPTGNLTIRLPTRLTGDEYWHQFNSTSVYKGINESGGIYERNNIYEVELNIDTSNESNEFKLNTVGIQSKPSEDGASLKQNVGTSSDDTNRKNNDVFEFKSYNAERDGNDVTYDFELSAGNADIDRVRIEVRQTSSNKVRDSDEYTNINAQQYSQEDGKLAIGTDGGAEVNFIAEDKNGIIIQETIPV